jgi:hypothetical protein
MEVSGELPATSALLLGNESKFLFHLELVRPEIGYNGGRKKSFP